MTPTVLAAAAEASAPWWVAPAVIAAVVTAVVAMMTLVVNGRRARTDRQRALFAEAFGDIAAYQEFVYIVRRRRHDQPEAERVRISTELSGVQRRLNHHRAVLKVEAPRVARSFGELLDAARRIAGAAIRDGWNTPPITADSDVHVNVDLTEITAFEDSFLVDVADHVAVTAWWIRRAGRALRAAPRHAWRRLRMLVTARRHRPAQESPAQSSAVRQ